MVKYPIYPIIKCSLDQVPPGKRKMQKTAAQKRSRFQEKGEAQKIPEEGKL